MQKAIVFSAILISISLMVSAAIVSKNSNVDRYSFSLATTLDNQQWVTVGDTYAGKSWSCTTKHNRDEYKGQDNFFLPKDFNGCLEMVNPVEKIR